jgi:hypothetical protein
MRRWNWFASFKVSHSTNLSFQSRTYHLPFITGILEELGYFKEKISIQSLEFFPILAVPSCPS